MPVSRPGRVRPFGVAIGDILGRATVPDDDPRPRYTSGGLKVTEDGIPIAYSALEKGVPVVSASGREFGKVEHVLEIPSEDLFDGIVVTTGAGLRFVDRDQIELITTTRVRCALTDEQAAALKPPDGEAVFTTDASADTGSSLRDRFGRMFGRAHWKRES